MIDLYFRMQKEDIWKRSAVQIEVTDKLTDRKEIVPVNDTYVFTREHQIQ